MFGGGPWRGRVLLLGLLLVLYLAAAVFISGLHDVHPGFANRVLRGGHGFLVSDSSGGVGQRFYQLGGIPNTYRLLPGRRPRLQWCSHLDFQQPPGPAVALVSFPGSGNTWLRYLIQQATGLYTGSVYKDLGLLQNGFPAESVVNGSVVVVKTHEWGPRARAPFSRAVLLVRTPSAAIQAEFNRQSGGHIGFASPERYKRMKGQYWQQFVTNNLASWRDTYLDWLFIFTGPTHVIFYEKLVQDVAGTLKGLMHFLNMTQDAAQMACALSRKEGIYRRRKRVLNFDPYTPDMKAALKKQQAIVYQAIYASVSVTSNDPTHYSTFL